MYQPSKKLSILQHFYNIYDLCRCFGLVNFTFNPVEKRFKVSRRLQFVSAVIYTVFACVYGTFAFFMILQVMLAYTNIVPFKFELSSVQLQDQIISDIDRFCHLVGGSLIGVNFNSLRSMVLHSTNKIFSILQGIPSDALIYIDEDFNGVLLLKNWCTLIVTVIRLLFTVYVVGAGIYILAVRASLQASFSMVLIMLISVMFSYVNLTVTLMHLAHVYSQLALLCVYSKLGELLEVASRQPGLCQLRKAIRRSFKISFEVHCIKKDLDTFFAVSHFISYMRAIAQVQNLYYMLKAVFYNNDSGTFALGSILLTKMPIFMMLWLDVYLIGRLSDMLVATHNRFQGHVWSVIVERNLFDRKDLQQRMDLELFETHVYDLNTSILGSIKIDQQFAFDYLMNIILTFVITFLQFYAGEEFYKPIQSNDTQAVVRMNTV